MVVYERHKYDHLDSAVSYGLEAAQKQGLAEESIFNTLVVNDDKDLFVALSA